MIPRRPAQIFRSRWSAIFWAVGVILFAVMTIGFAPSKASHPDANAPENAAQPTDATGQPVSDDDLKLIANLIG